MNRRAFLARLFAAPIVALALLKAPLAEREREPAFDYDLEAKPAMRFDVLYGVQVLQPTFSCRVLS